MARVLSLFSHLGVMVTTLLLIFFCHGVKSSKECYRLKRDWIILTAFIVAGVGGYLAYNKWAEEGLRRTEACFN